MNLFGVIKITLISSTQIQLSLKDRNSSQYVDITWTSGPNITQGAWVYIYFLINVKGTSMGNGSNSLALDTSFTSLSLADL